MPAGPVTASRSPSLTPVSAAVAADSRATAACRVPASASSPSWSRPWSSSSRWPASTASPSPGRGSGCARSPAGRWRAAPVQPPSRSSSRAYGAQVRQARGGRPGRRRACAAPGRRSARGGAVIWSGLSAASNSRALPSQLRKVPAFSATAATGSTTSARSVTSLGRSSRLTRKPTSSSAARARAGSGRSATSTPPTSSAPQLAGRPRPRRSGRCRGRSRCGQLGDAPDGGDLVAGPRVGGRAAAGQQRRAARPPRPRRARRPGAGSTPAWRRSRWRPVRAAVSPPGTAASRSPTTITAPSARSASAAAGPVALQADAARERVQPLGLGAGRGGQQRAARLRPVRGWRAWRARRSAGRACGAPCAAAGRRRAPPPRTRSRPAARRAPSPARCT